MDYKELNEIKLGNVVTAFELGGGEIPKITDELEELPKLDARFSKDVPEKFIEKDKSEEMENDIRAFIEEQVRIDNEEIEYLSLCAMRLSVKTGYIHNIHSDNPTNSDGKIDINYKVKKSDVKITKSQIKILKATIRETEKQLKHRKKLSKLMGKYR